MFCENGLLEFALSYCPIVIFSVFSSFFFLSGSAPPQPGYLEGVNSAPLTFTAGIRLHELFLGASFLELGGQPRQLWENLVDQTDLGGQIVLVDIESQMAADEAYGGGKPG
jgi:hypothetical protein